MAVHENMAANRGDTLDQPIRGLWHQSALLANGLKEAVTLPKDSRHRHWEVHRVEPCQHLKRQVSKRHATDSLVINQACHHAPFVLRTPGGRSNPISCSQTAPCVRHTLGPTLTLPTT
mmetsp:Transcript_7000/g.42933  ORF Transcript_7000/g.42933 Transcript_7000/m.42933 type:complete len:118 (+) Transcript_7000:2496-2849(+)